MALTDEDDVARQALTPRPSTKLSGEVALVHGIALPGTLKEVSEFGQYMAKAGSMIPTHLREKPGSCMAVIMDAAAWGMNPFAVARQHMEVHGVGSYMAQLITAVIRKHAPVKERVWTPIYEGEGATLKCTIKVHHAETGEEIVYESPIVGPFVPGIDSGDASKGKRAPDNFVGIWPKNSPLWRSDPRQQLYYYSMRAMARRYFPEILLGVYDPEEAYAAAQMRDITPKETENFLEDKPAEEPHAEPEPIERAAETIRSAMYDDLAADPETGELPEEEGLTRKMTEEEVVEMMLGQIARMEPQQRLDEYVEAQHNNILDLPKEQQKRVRKAILDRSIDLEDL